MIDKKLPGTAQAGFTLIELMITITILAVLLAIGVPAYQNYIATATEGTLVKNINTMEMFQEDFFLRNGNYSVGLANIAAIDAAIGWEPRTDDGVTYSVASFTPSSAFTLRTSWTSPVRISITVRKL